MDISSIQNAGVLRGFSQDDLAAVGAVASEREFSRKECLFRRGEEATTFYVAARGQFSLTVPLRVHDDYTSVAVEEKGPLEAFGWSALVDPRTSIYSCYCIEDGAAVTFPREPLAAVLAANPRLGAEFLGNLTELIGARVRVTQDLWLDEVSQSMARVHHWTRTELTGHLADAMKEPGRVRSWVQRIKHPGEES